MKMLRFFSMAIVAMCCSVALAQNSATTAGDGKSRNNNQRQQQQRQQQQRQQQRQRQEQRSNIQYQRVAQNSPASQSYSHIYAEYNPMTWHFSYGGETDNTSFQGVSVGYDYYTPISSNFYFKTGAKGQYFFREKNDLKTEMLCGTIPLDFVLDLRTSNGFGFAPYAGLFGRYNFSATMSDEYDNEVDFFDENDTDGDPIKRFQFGWEAGVNFRVSDIISFGVGYWMDLSEICDHEKLYGFNIRFGASF